MEIQIEILLWKKQMKMMKQRIIKMVRIKTSHNNQNKEIKMEE